MCTRTELQELKSIKISHHQRRNTDPKICNNQTEKTDKKLSKKIITKKTGRLLRSNSSEDECEKHEKIKITQKLRDPRNGIVSPSQTSIYHQLWPQIDKIVEEQVALAKLDISESKHGWQLLAKEGELEMYRREVVINNVTLNPFKSVNVVKGVTGHEVCHYFFNPEYRYDWETTLERMVILEKISDDTIVFHQVHKTMWPIRPRDSVFWSHIRRLPDEKGKNLWAVVNYSTEHPNFPPNVGKYIRLFLSTCLLCETVVNPPEDGRNISRENLTCKITYCSVINPGLQAPATVLRSIYRREYPKFLKKFTAFVKNETKNKPIMY